MVKGIEQLKTNNLIDLKTWLVFPCDNSLLNNDIYAKFCNCFFRYLKEKKTFILPSDDDGFCHVFSAMRVRSREFKALLNQKETKKYFDRTEWVTQKISNPDFKTINTWIEQQYKVPLVGFKELCEKVDDSFFKSKSDEWLLKFYQCISDMTELWKASNRKIPAGPLRNKAFIRTSKNNMVVPFDTNGNLNVYLPTKGTSDYQFVKSVFLTDKDSKKLFKSLNIKTPDLIDEVNEHVIPRLSKTTNPYRGLREDIQKIFRAIRKADSDDEKLMIQKLKNIAWLSCKNNLTKKLALYKPDDVYYPTKLLVSLVGKSTTSNFLDTSLFSDSKSKQNAKSILEDVGVYFRPRRFYRQDDDLTFENRNAPTENYWNGEEIELEGLNEYLRKPIDKKASINLWSTIIKSSEDWKTSGYANTKFIQQLKETKWLFSKFGQRQKPREITPTELDEAYEDSIALMTVLEFKADEIKDFELEHNGKFLSNDDLQKLKDEMIELKREIERLKEQYEPTQEDLSENNLPDIDDIKIGDELSSDEIPPTDNDIPDDYQIDDYTDNGSNGSVGVMTSSVPTKRQRKIGIRGEEFVLKLLREYYKHDSMIEVCDLNEDDKLGVGCDIIIKKNSVAQTLIEVKATEGGYENKFKVSEKQWRTAIKSHLDNNEPEYHIYCVYYAGGTSPQHIIIKDPVEWMLKRQLRFVEQWFNVRSIKR